MCITVGKVSLDDWLWLTSSLGWIGFFDPTTPPASWMARLAITSLAFMLVWVPRAGLEHDERELAVQLPVDHLLGGPDDQVDLLRRQLAQLAVGQGRALLEDAEGADHGPAPAVALHADREIDVGPLGLGAPEMIRRDLDVAQHVLFGSEPDVRTRVSST